MPVLSEEQRAAATAFKEVDEARYDEMLGVLPPALWTAKGFLVVILRWGPSCCELVSRSFF
jgi:hypothetical protein